MCRQLATAGIHFLKSMGVNVRVKRGKLYLDTYIQGKRSWESLGLTLGADPLSNKEAHRLADIICKKREFQIASGEWGLVDSIAGKQSLVDYVTKLAAKQPPKNHLPKSIKYLSEYAKDVRISSVNEQFLEGYQEYLTENGLAAQTASLYFQALKTALKKAVRDRVLLRNPADSIKGIKVPETVKLSLSIEEVQKLADTPLGGDLGAEVRRAFLFDVFTGIRVSDLKLLVRGEIIRDPPQIRRVQKKTGRVVMIDLHPIALKIIEDHLEHDPGAPVFPLIATTKTNTNQYLQKWAKDAKLGKSLGWHTARHTFAVLTLEGGADFYTVSKLLGHTKPQTTAVYAKATDKMKRLAVEGLPDIRV